MSKANLRNLSLGGIAGGIVGFITLMAGIFVGATTVATGPTSSSVTAVGNMAVVILGGLLLTLAVIAAFVAWIAGLIRTGMSQQWLWFILMLVFGSVVTLVYSFIGPEGRAAQPTLSPSGMSAE